MDLSMQPVKDHARASADRHIQIDAKNVDGRVTITTSDEDRFPLQVSEVINAVLRVKADEQARDRFQFLLKRLGSWILARSDVRGAYLTLRDGGLCFIAVHNQPAYDAAFEDALSALDIEIANDRDIPFHLEVMSLPPVSDTSMQSFLHELTLHFRGKRE